MQNASHELAQLDEASAMTLFVIKRHTQVPWRMDFCKGRRQHHVEQSSLDIYGQWMHERALMAIVF
jgi:hypothetical protein